MTDAVFDFKSIARIANLRALDGRPQTEDKPVEMPCDSNPQEDWYAYAGFSVRAVDDLSGYTAPTEDCA